MKTYVVIVQHPREHGARQCWRERYIVQAETAEEVRLKVAMDRGSYAMNCQIGIPRDFFEDPEEQVIRIDSGYVSRETAESFNGRKISEILAEAKLNEI